MGVVAGIGLDQEWVEIQVVEMGAASPDLAQELGAPDDVGQSPGAQRGQNLADLLGDEAEQVDHLLRCAGEFLAQPRILGAHAHRASVGVALANHDAAHGNKRGRPDAKLFGAQ